MSDYCKKRVDYVNSWPDVKMFQAEYKFQKRCEDFMSKYGVQPFMPMKLWDSNDKDYNIAVSRIIECLEVVPYKPHYAFSFAFTAIDNFSKHCYGDSVKLIDRIHKIIDDILKQISQNKDVEKTIKFLYEVMPMQGALFLYNETFKNAANSNGTFRRMNDSTYTDDHYIISDINTHFGYDPQNYNNTIRQGAAFLKKLLIQDKLIVNGNEHTLSDKAKLNFIISGFLYGLRNASAHGSSISTTKSSKTTVERYALNYYAFLSAYTVLMLMIINDGDASIEATRYCELYNITKQNKENMELLFGNHLG